jgi:GTPase SAR1 family protein
MLRQIHIFLKGEHLFCKNYALALNAEELNNIKEILNDYIELPLPGKVSNRPLSNYQIFHTGEGNLYFLFITDLIDSLEYIETIITKTIKKFKELFPDPLKIKESNISTTEFLRFLNLLQKDLHSKIALIGPNGAGKTTFYNMLRSGGERTIMNFAKSSSFEMEGLSFDIWDFQLNDNFSPLWSKFISGSDLIILIFDLSNYHLKVIDHFLNLHKLESNLSELLILGNKLDAVEEVDIRRIKNELKIRDFNEISLIDIDSKEVIIDLLRETLKLKKNLPQNFEELIKEADELKLYGNNVQALAKYNELIKICNIYQDFTYLKSLQEKAEQLRKILDQQVKIRKEIESKKEFEIPPKLKFAKKVEVKPLPGAKSMPEIPEEDFQEGIQPSKSEEKMIAFQQLEKKPKELKIIKTLDKTTRSTKTKLTPKDLKIVIPTDEKAKIKEIKMPAEVFPPLEGSKEIIVDSKLSDYATELQKFIMEKGSSLSLGLCQQLIIELQKSLGRSISIDDIKLAAEFFVKQEQEM